MIHLGVLIAREGGGLGMSIAYSCSNNEHDYYRGFASPRGGGGATAGWIGGGW